MDYREPRHVLDDAIWCPDCGWVGRMSEAVVGSDGERLCPDCHAVGVSTPVERDPDAGGVRVNMHCPGCDWEGPDYKLLECCSCEDGECSGHPRQHWCKGPFHAGCPICFEKVVEKPKDGYDELARDIASEEEAWPELR